MQAPDRNMRRFADRDQRVSGDQTTPVLLVLLHRCAVGRLHPRQRARPLRARGRPPRNKRVCAETDRDRFCVSANRRLQTDFSRPGPFGFPSVYPYLSVPIRTYPYYDVVFLSVVRMGDSLFPLSSLLIHHFFLEFSFKCLKIMANGCILFFCGQSSGTVPGLR